MTFAAQSAAAAPFNSPGRSICRGGANLTLKG
jgi:hypothetical protein